MAYQVLARKYRPQRFADVAGQDHVTRTLANALAQKRIAHGYIFSGHRGIGKTTIARILAMALNCQREVGSALRPTIEPCLECPPCREISSGGEALSHSFDFIEIDAASNRGIDDVRSIISQAEVRPARDRYKIFLLDEAHQITDAAFNAILKTLEEPPEWVIFMMATTEPESIPQTIRSRCQHFSFHAVKFDDILAQLKAIAEREQVTAEDSALALLAEAGDGSMRDALSIMDQAIASAPLQPDSNGIARAVLQTGQIRELMGSVPNAVFERLMEAVGAQQPARLMEDLNQLLTSGNSPSALARQLVRYLRNCLMAKLGGENTALLEIAQDERARAARTALLFTEDDLTRNLQIALRTFDDMNSRHEQRFHLELGLLKLIQAQRLLPIEQILSGLASQGSQTDGAARPTPPSRPASTPSRAIAPPPPQAPSLSPFAPGGQRADQAAPWPERARQGLYAPDAGASHIAPMPPSSSPETAGALALSEPEYLSIEMDIQASAETRPQIVLPPPIPPASVGAASGMDSADDIRAAVVQALAAGGHATAATLLEDGQWTIEAGSIRIEINTGQKMIAITFNAAAEKLMRQALAQAGAPSRFLLISAKGQTGSGNALRVRAALGSIEHEARNHPLVLQAQALFNAEVVSVVDLRSP